MTFGSWTYDMNEIVINFSDGKQQIELNDYSISGIWDLLEGPAVLAKGRSKISYNIRIKRQNDKET